MEPTTEKFVGDEQAQAFVNRDRRKGFEIET